MCCLSREAQLKSSRWRFGRIGSFIPDFCTWRFPSGAQTLHGLQWRVVTAPNWKNSAGTVDAPRSACARRFRPSVTVPSLSCCKSQKPGLGLRVCTVVYRLLPSCIMSERPARGCLISLRPGLISAEEHKAPNVCFLYVFVSTHMHVKDEGC